MAQVYFAYPQTCHGHRINLFKLVMVTTGPLHTPLCIKHQLVSDSCNCFLSVYHNYK